MIKVTPWDGKPISSPGVYAQVPLSTYHSGTLCTGPSISSSGLRTIFTQSPLEFWINSPLNPNRLPREEKRHFSIGSCLHHLALGEAEFSKYFIIRPAEYEDAKTSTLKKWTRASHYCKAWEDSAEASGRTIITPDELEMIKGMVGIQPWQKGLDDSGLLNNAVVRAGALQGLVEHAVVSIDPETGIFLLSKPDTIPLDSTEGVDLKSCLSVEPHKLQRTLDDLRYDCQGAVLSTCLEQAADIRLTNFTLIFVSKNEPHEVAVREIWPADMDEAAKDNRAALRTFALCLERGKWPGQYGATSDAQFIARSERNRERAALRREQLELAMLA